MRAWPRLVFLCLAIGGCLVLPDRLKAGAPLDEPDPEPHPPAPSREVRAAWKGAGATFGWMRTGETGHHFFEARDYGAAGEIPAFQLFLLRPPVGIRPPVAIDRLPEPGSRSACRFLRPARRKTSGP